MVALWAGEAEHGSFTWGRRRSTTPRRDIGHAECPTGSHAISFPVRARSRLSCGKSSSVTVVAVASRTVPHARSERYGPHSYQGFDSKRCPPPDPLPERAGVLSRVVWGRRSRRHDFREAKWHRSRVSQHSSVTPRWPTMGSRRQTRSWRFSHSHVLVENQRSEVAGARHIHSRPGQPAARLTCPGWRPARSR